MVINLKKGEKIDLTKSNPGLSKIVVGLGWDANESSGSEYDLDASVFMLNKEGILERSQNLIYFGNLNGPGVHHTGDNLTGEGDGDDEVINVDLSQIPSDIDKLIFTVNIYNGKSKRQNFGHISNAYIRVINPSNRQELIRYDLGEDYSTETGLMVGEIYREENEWKFSAIDESFEGGLSSLRSQMEKGKNNRNPSGEEKKGLFSRLFG